MDLTYPWLAGNEGMEKKMETIIMGYIGITTRIHSFIPSYPIHYSRVAQSQAMEISAPLFVDFPAGSANPFSSVLDLTRNVCYQALNPKPLNP